MFGDQISGIALPLTAVLALHVGAAQMGYLVALEWLPSLLFGLPVGALVDRRGRRRLTMIAADLGRAALFASIPAITMDLTYSRSGQPAEPPRPPAPAPVLSAVKLMYAAAAVITITLIISLALIGGTKDTLRTPNPSLTAAQVRDLNALITPTIVSGLAVIALWLWMARANGQGRNWARILSTALFGLATLELIKAYPGSNLGHFVLGGQVQPMIHYGFA
jgi:MFS family permease